MHASTPAALKDPSSLSTDVRSRVGTLVAGRYRIVRMIGEGGMGAVFEAEVLGASERVAVKLIKPEYSMSAEVNGRFLQEVRAASAVGHPNIVRMLDAGSDAYGPYMVLELLKGETLCDALDRRALGPREALGVMAATLDALQAAHGAGVVHRDIKPENIFLVGGADRCETVKLLDFGISKILSMQSAMSGITRVGTAVGTPDYMSPEQAGGGRVDGRADLWSVGAVLYEAISLAHPFEGESYQQLISNIVLHPHTPLRRRVPAAPPQIEAFIDRALRKEPAERFASAGEMFLEARRLLDGLPPDESIGYRHDEPTSVMRSAPNEPTQVIEVRAMAAASPARPQRPPRDVGPMQVPSRPGPQGPPPSVWRDEPEAPTLLDAPAHVSNAPSTAHGDERAASRNAITIAAVIAGILVFGALALRIRSAAVGSESPITASAPEPVQAAPPAPEIAAAAPPEQTLTTPTAQVLSPPAPPAPRPVDRVVERVAPTPRRVTVSAPPPTHPGTADARMTVLRMALPSLRACAAGPPRYVGNIDAMVFFDARGRAHDAQVRTPSRMTVHGACIVRALERLVVPSAANSAVPMFQTFR